jgi:prepilin-type N-terminal cleavage/methylation domain-containing protein
MTARRGLREWLGGQAGMTLPELMVTMVVASLILTSFLTIMVAAQKDIIHQQGRSRTNDQARNAMEEIDRELRSATVLYDPASEPSPSVAYYGLRFETQANSPTQGGRTCVQYRISSDQLLRRTWPTATPASATGWWVVATGIVNYDQSVPAFQLDTSSAEGAGAPMGSRAVNIVLVVDDQSTDSATDRITSSIAIRNQSVGDPCTPVPAG